MTDQPRTNDVPNASVEDEAGPALPGFGAPQPAASPAPAYRVLARKYRPLSFDDLIGQEAMVRTLSNAFSTGRIPQAWMLTGVRGVGKTTTARILARALNYEPLDGSPSQPTIQMPTLGRHCAAIMESRHVDVLEMDAASHTGVEDVRQIIDGIRYAPSSARYKVYIIDEVHMLSEKAFNAFLKTLEEPPPHAKFVFATTEIRKVPVTILSRCQRFDLRRIDAGALVAHLGRITEAEGVNADPEALALIARAAEGSARDSLSLLDQAIAHGGGAVTTEEVRTMLGLADRARVIDLFEAVMRGDLAAALAELTAQYDAGADPYVVLNDLAGFIHLVTRFKLVPDAGKDAALTEAERLRGADLASLLSLRILARSWQILIKGLPEVQQAARPIAAAEMLLVRLAYAADLPTPDEALRALRDGAPAAGGNGGGARPSGGGGNGGGPRLAIASTGSALLADATPRPDPAQEALRAAAEPQIRLARFEDVVALAGEKRDIVLKRALEQDAHLVHFDDGHIEFALREGGSRTLAGDLGKRLQEWTGRRWMVALSSKPGAPTLHEMAQAREAERRSGAEGHPLVQAVLSRFPGSAIVDIRDIAAAEETQPPPAGTGEVADDEGSLASDDDLSYLDDM
ncbi:DNA polymerase III subunit gamma/tau [Chelatococcus asaccharovorans]|uniref:DNA polymerase III subunit gamma/tau n=1 Tax=Chelatococcus asaccharovorans TaxID=28210 RepID=A0A2V3UGT8_9HYPH|nr:DNA polymerase III subunit gamma/tau [Chelatococcus asaccharovorans]MBS7701719.1 DNA polymerase III subunit gamma/tau [Chelatococcus asaccharovorans]PXW64575.1 DNA polymerase-3 subunit gamma/tau [Chelatococcus asaccharovorans]